MSMEPRIKRWWSDALRSGYYTPGHGYLRLTTEDGDEFCPLGVLLDVLEPDAWERLEGSNAWAWHESPEPLQDVHHNIESKIRSILHPRDVATFGISHVPMLTLLRLGLPPCGRVWIPTDRDDDHRKLDTWARDHTVTTLNDVGMPWDQLAAWIETQL